MSKGTETRDEHGEEFERMADAKRSGIVAEYLAFLHHNKKWWLLPIVTLLLGVGILVAVGGTAAGPWLYALF